MLDPCVKKNCDIHFGFVLLACTVVRFWCLESPEVLGSRKSRKLFVPEKPFVKLRPAYSVTLALSYVVNGWKIKIRVKFCASRCRCFDDTKGIMSLEMRPKSFHDFRDTGPRGLIHASRVFVLLTFTSSLSLTGSFTRSPFSHLSLCFDVLDQCRGDKSRYCRVAFQLNWCLSKRWSQACCKTCERATKTGGQ